LLPHSDSALCHAIVDPLPTCKRPPLTIKVRGRLCRADCQHDSASSTGLPLLSSKPGAPNTLYLDFNGHVSPMNSAWGGFNASAFSWDNDTSTFSLFEQLSIENIWRRVVEDYAPFRYDVTTVSSSWVWPITHHACT